MTSTLHDVAGSIIAGCSSTVIGHPLDTIKVHQQTWKHPHLSNNASTVQVIKHIIANDSNNILRLYRGIGPPMANQIFMTTVMFSVFQKVKTVFNNNGAGSNDNLSAMFAGLISGFATACISTPTDWVKIQIQLQAGHNNNNSSGRSTTSSLSILHKLLHDNQYQVMKVTRTLYQGHVANLAREGVFTMVYLGLYDRISYNFKEYHLRQVDQEFTLFHVMCISSFTGACAWVCNYPFDTLKTVMQGGGLKKTGQHIGMYGAFRSIWASGGFKAFFRGVGSSTGRAMIVTSCRMMAYQWTLKYLNNNHD